VRIRFYINELTGQPHIYAHGVGEDEVADILGNPAEDVPGREGSRVATGQTAAGRYLQVVYVPDPQPGSMFVITAYDLKGKPFAAFRRRRRGK
jgi:hypothetical protein